MNVVFDLDGTLANIEHRLHFIKDGRRDWDAFFKACVDDKPNYEICDIARAMYRDGHVVDIWSGRSDLVRQETVAWLKNHWIGYRTLSMRTHGDHRPDDVLKGEWMEAYLKDWGSYPNLAFDDRQRVVDEWRKRGIPCCQVAEGQF